MTTEDLLKELSEVGLGVTASDHMSEVERANICSMTIKALSAEVEALKASKNFHRDMGITTLDAKWLDPECHRGCKSLIWKKERDLAIEETHRWSEAEKKDKARHEEVERQLKAERDALKAALVWIACAGRHTDNPAEQVYACDLRARAQAALAQAGQDGGTQP